jgi:lipopolysaccharide transport system permease protein
MSAPSQDDLRVHQSVTEIRAGVHESWRQLLQDLWRYRELFLSFVERDLKVRYKQTVLGVIWVILVPLLMSGALAIILGRVVKMPKNHEALPYLLFFLAAMVPWQCFANGLAQASVSLEGNSGLILTVYFPRIIVPFSVLCTTVVDFVIGWIFFNILAACYGYWTWLFIVFTPVLLALQLFTALGVGLIFSVLNAQYRDIRYAVPVAIQFAMLMTPVLYPAARLPSWLRWGTWMNPMAGIIETYRALLVGDYIPYRLLAINIAVATALVVLGTWFFQKRLQRIIDIL